MTLSPETKLPTEDGHYWATAIYHKGHERRRVVWVVEWEPGTFCVWEPGETETRKISDFADWSERLLDPKETTTHDK